MSSKFRIGALRELYTQPLYRAFQSSPNPSGELLFDTPAVHIERLMSKECDTAFVAPMDYALNSSDLILNPHIGVNGTGFEGMLRLYLREELQAITSMAFGNVVTTDVVLSRIVLAEKYDSAPTIIPVVGSVDEMLSKADCALINVPLEVVHPLTHPFIDIVDEWTDVTDLPFVHTLSVSRSESFNKELSTLLLESQQAGRIEIDAIAYEIAKEKNLSSENVRDYFSHFSYEFDEHSKQSLETFFQMAFFHGLLGDVPEINIGV